MTSGPGEEPEPKRGEPRLKRMVPKLTVANIVGGALTTVGALAAGAQLLDYIQSGKLNFIMSAVFVPHLTSVNFGEKCAGAQWPRQERRWRLPWS